MPTNALAILLSFYHIVTICQILFSYIFDKIEQKTDIKANNMGKLIKRIIK